VSTTVPPAAPGPSKGRCVVVKVGSSSVTGPGGRVAGELLADLGAQIAALRRLGHSVVVVTSGAIAAGWGVIGRDRPRPEDTAVLQAVSAVGQLPVMSAWGSALAGQGLQVGVVLLTALDLVHRRQYLRARTTLSRLLSLGAVPVVNENDAVADEEIRFGDNDRLAALVAQLVDADLLVLLTDAPGLLTADPRLVPDAELIEEVERIGDDLEALAGGPGSSVGSGGMSSKVAAARIATWSGITTVIADASRPGVLDAAAGARPGTGTVFLPGSRRYPARKLWIAFAVGVSGVVVVDAGARRAIVEDGRSLLAAGVVAVDGAFEPDDVVDVTTPGGQVFARGMVRYPAARAASWMGRKSADLPDDLPRELIHRDDLIVLVHDAVAPGPAPDREGLTNVPTGQGGAQR